MDECNSQSGSEFFPDIKILGKNVQVKVRVVRMDSEEYREFAL